MFMKSSFFMAYAMSSLFTFDLIPRQENDSLRSQ
jgi:hypothetical protein